MDKPSKGDSMVIQRDLMGFNGIYDGIPSAKHSQFATLKMAISQNSWFTQLHSMVIFHSYVNLPDGIYN